MAEMCGFVYVVNTQAYLDEVRASVASLRRHMPDAQVAIITHGHLFADDPSVIWVPLTCAPIPVGDLCSAPGFA